jgi:predicted RNase H-like HicB family nuclease
MIENGYRSMELTANIHLEDGCYWADVPKLPGCFASGENLDELFESLHEGIRLYLDEEDPAGGPSSQPLRVTAAILSDAGPA